MVTVEETPVTALEPKTRLTGKVVKTTLAGALIDVGHQLPGVLHISQLQKDPVKKVEDVIHEGQSVEVWVRKVRKDRIELTMIEPLRYDWKELEPGLVTTGKVVRLETYGAFVDIGAERPGMVHISELAAGYVRAAGDVVKEGDEVEVKVLSVDPKKRQIRLSMKALQPEPEPEEVEKPRRKPRKDKHDRSAPQTEQAVEETEEEEAPTLTAMQIAWQSAQDRARAKGKPRAKRAKPGSAEREEILNRTLEKRMPTGA
jgi:small subunit ribosomal protein S1